LSAKVRSIFPTWCCCVRIRPVTSPFGQGWSGMRTGSVFACAARAE